MEIDMFTRFRRKLADVVTVAINSGRRVTATKRDAAGACCPLGCIVDQFGYPAPGVARLLERDLPHMAPTAFADGFDGESRGHYIDDDRLPYYELGKLYRERFP